MSTTFVNIYREGKRTQVIEALAGPVSVADLPAAWSRVPVVLLGPIANELLGSWATQFPDSIVGITPQGWMRKWEGDGHVSSTRWEDAEPYLGRADAVILSREDAGGDDAYILELARQARVLLVTDGWHPASLYLAGSRYNVPARPAKEVDPTGAGDIFATAFLIRLAETGDPLVAARFATVVASMSVEGPGMSTIPDRARVEDWLSRHS
jgi:sugar/nucleoside kinase (ribokinase family)